MITRAKSSIGVYSRGPACPVRNCTGDPDGGATPHCFLLGSHDRVHLIFGPGTLGALSILSFFRQVGSDRGLASRIDQRDQGECDAAAGRSFLFVPGNSLGNAN